MNSQVIPKIEDLRPLQETDLAVGEPLTLPVYDRYCSLLVQVGLVIQNERQKEILLSRGGFVPKQREATKTNVISVPRAATTIETLNLLQLEVGLLHKQILSGTSENLNEQVNQLTAVIEEQLDHDTDAALAAMQLQLDPANHAARQTHAAIICVFTARALGLDARTIRSLGNASITYDLVLGPLAAHLNAQTTPLTPSQLAQIRTHPEIAVQLLEAAGIHDTVWLDSVLHHHERLDGSGYPDGLKGDEIVSSTRLLAIVDIYTALLRPRTYRDAMPARQALRQIFLDRGKQIDESIAALLIKELGIQPPGTLVRLASREVGIVTRRGGNALCPQVTRLITAEGFLASANIIRDTSIEAFQITDSVPYDHMFGVATKAAKFWDS